MNTLVLDPMPKEFWQHIEKYNWQDLFFTSDEYDPSNIEIIIVRTRSVLTGQIISSFPKLQLIIRAGSGFDNIDVKEALKRDIVVSTTPEANVQCAFEHTISLILALLKQHQQGKEQILNSKWKQGIQSGWEISDLKALVVGVGRIGSRIGEFLQNMGADVRGVDPFLSPASWGKCKIPEIKFLEGIKWCNLLTFHCPLYEKTHHYFSKTVLSQLSAPIWLINTARGGIVDDISVQLGLKEGLILGFGADVFDKEPVEFKKYFRRNNVLITPHIGSNTSGARNRLVSETINVWKGYVKSKKIINQIDPRFI